MPDKVNGDHAVLSSISGRLTKSQKHTPPIHALLMDKRDAQEKNVEMVITEPMESVTKMDVILTHTDSETTISSEKERQ